MPSVSICRTDRTPATGAGPQGPHPYQDAIQLQAEMRDGTAPAVTEPAFPPAVKSAIEAAGGDQRLALIHLPGANLWKPLATLQRLGWHPIMPWAMLPATTSAPTDAVMNLHDLVPAGAAIFGQIPHADAAISALAGSRKILVVGELRGHLVACLQQDWHEQATAAALPDRKAGNPERSAYQAQMCRFLRSRGPALFSDLLATLAWATEADVLILRLEDLPSPDAVPDDDLPPALHPFRRQAFATVGRVAPVTPVRPGLTDQASPNTGSPVPLREIWSDEAERLFSAFGGCHLNQALGYDQPYMVAGHARPS